MVSISQESLLNGVKSVFMLVSTYLATFRKVFRISQNFAQMVLVHHGPLVFL